ncbi:hypothetical protein M407DRAFT_31203 [Tulasnella calospora MUT 4182]|uniref:Uncharacterized protein n=1 Tax=Tulasnella calospora MUT 4182 TaxID=1051891 RepID=A0A0C3Q606_9AGAM|nr:hypothetical protein M407DRAFT_31203 [Tulasnella calospora MUT 4182]
MPGRPTTPPTPTGTHLVTIWNPWPADIRVDPKKGIDPDDCRDLARWISCIVGVDNVSKDTIIVEISDFNRHQGRILGEHLWINVFKRIVRITVYCPISTLIEFYANDPWQQQVEDKQKSSKLYLCPLGDYLELEKQRWRETKVDPDWFERRWNPNKNSMVNMPYPKTRWCGLPDHHGIDEFCSKIPLSLFPEEEAARAKPREPVLPENELSALTTPGATGWNRARREGTRIPTARVRPALDPASRPQPQQPVARNYRKVEIVTTEQGMRAVLAPSVPKHLTLDENGLPNLEPEHFNWFDEVEDEDAAAAWRQQEPPNWELRQLSMETQRLPVVAPSENAGPSWDDESEASAPVGYIV